MEDLVAIAKIARPRGLRGEVVGDLLTDFPERFDELENVVALLPSGERSNLKINDFAIRNGRINIKFRDIDMVEAAELLRDAVICVSESDAVKLDAGEYYDWELEGCSVETVSGEMLGKVTSLMRTGGTEILVVKGPLKEYLVPYAESICIEVDVSKRLIRIDPPEGLLEF